MGCLQIGFAERCFFTTFRMTIKNQGSYSLQKTLCSLCLCVSIQSHPLTSMAIFQNNFVLSVSLCFNQTPTVVTPMCLCVSIKHPPSLLRRASVFQFEAPIRHPQRRGMKEKRIKNRKKCCLFQKKCLTCGGFPSGGDNSNWGLGKRLSNY